MIPLLLIPLIKIVCVIGVMLTIVAYTVFAERKICAWMQDRIGPNRVGLGFGIIPGLKDKHMMGLGQPLADGIKFIISLGAISPDHANLTDDIGHHLTTSPPGAP